MAALTIVLTSVVFSPVFSMNVPGPDEDGV
jgi:hypothetical protein